MVAAPLVFFFFRATIKPTIISPSTASPPTTPPTIAPIGADFFAGTDGGGVAVGSGFVEMAVAGPEVVAGRVVVVVADEVLVVEGESEVVAA